MRRMRVRQQRQDARAAENAQAAENTCECAGCAPADQTALVQRERRARRKRDQAGAGIPIRSSLLVRPCRRRCRELRVRAQECATAARVLPERDWLGLRQWRRDARAAKNAHECVRRLPADQAALVRREAVVWPHA
jgi:hypothetical protein